ncbi:MAG: transcriptional regulator NrdR [Novibacillus thermophilus]|uniref:Transcriptional repressor NrdR n=1 Tax=Novibacillus thermophilus TaxID=1471761 RepID=A0A1U9K4B7_9BACL|nr:transcriptional regulator NrdR [Novibacillus thermophilus]AQS54891.1 transcriptional regulator NrdR [Novibacillus thermophilus]
MRCPYCDHTGTRVLDSRPAHEGKSIRRRRECEACSRRFTTFETVEEKPLIVIKKDGSREEFNRDKLLRGLVRACEKRPVPYEELENLVSRIERDLQGTTEQEVSSRDIGEMAMEGLYHLDEVAYVRFASVYRQFKDINVFVKELEELLKKPTPFQKK